jgi:flagellar export protein FliJ
MAFRFRLARVLRLRTRLRQQTQDELAAMAANLAALRAEVAAAREAQAAAHAALAEAARVGVTGEELGHWAAYERGLVGREKALAAESDRVTEAIVRGRAELVERRRDERKLERLRERLGNRAQAEEARQEERVLDDLALRERPQGEGR